MKIFKKALALVLAACSVLAAVPQTAEASSKIDIGKVYVQNQTEYAAYIQKGGQRPPSFDERLSDKFDFILDPNDSFETTYNCKLKGQDKYIFTYDGLDMGYVTLYGKNKNVTIYGLYAGQKTSKAKITKKLKKAGYTFSGDASSGYRFAKPFSDYGSEIAIYVQIKGKKIKQISIAYENPNAG